ncbi:MAG TPA: hypothetical protein VNO19_05705 [Gemmatimonadales bacterium]|nr:hypothetical protein [Gemmatimonadales bacterium]
MHITREGGQVSLGDRPGLFWALGLFLFAGGALSIAMALGLAENAGELEAWERLASMGIGLGVCAGAAWWLARNPGTSVQLDLTRRSLRLVRWGILGRQVRELPFDQLESTLVEESEDSDGGRVWRPAVRLRSGGVLRLSELWSHDEPGVRTAVATVAEVCGLPTLN